MQWTIQKFKILNVTVSQAQVRMRLNCHFFQQILLYNIFYWHSYTPNDNAKHPLQISLLRNYFCVVEKSSNSKGRHDTEAHKKWIGERKIVWALFWQYFTYCRHVVLCFLWVFIAITRILEIIEELWMKYSQKCRKLWNKQTLQNNLQLK